MRRLLCPLLLSAAAFAQIPREVVPPGGTAQIKIFHPDGPPVTSGRIIADFDPEVFGDVAAATVFSATGDAYGVANFNGRHVDISFQSPLAGIGRLPPLPVAVINVPVLPVAPPGTTGTFRLTGTLSKEAQIGAVTIGGSLAIHSIAAAGSSFRITGTGFTPDTTVEIEGVVLAASDYASQEEWYVSLAAPAEITGKRVRVRKAAETVEYFAFLPARTAEGYQPIFPLPAYGSAGASVNTVGFYVAIQNPTAAPAEITVIAYYATGEIGRTTRVTIDPGGLYSSHTSTLGVANYGRCAVYASTPVRILRIDDWRLPTDPNAPDYRAALLSGTAEVTGPPLQPAARAAIAPPHAEATVQTGTVAGPFEMYAWVVPSGDFTISTSAPWLQASSTQYRIDARSLRPGVYSAGITVTPKEPNGVPDTAVVVLHVVSEPVLTATPAYLALDAAEAKSITLTSAGNPARFGATAGSAWWIDVSPSTGVTPATLTVKPRSEGLPPGSYAAEITIAGPGNALRIVVTLLIAGLPAMWVGAEEVQFLPREGSGPVAKYFLVEGNGGPVSASAATESSRQWLSVRAAPTFAGGPTYQVDVTANPTGLPPGRYKGSISLSSAGVPDRQVPVIMEILAANPPPLAVSGPELAFLAAFQSNEPRITLNVDSGGLPSQFTVSGTGVSVDPKRGITPATVDVSAPMWLFPGDYAGSVQFIGPRNSIDLPAKFTITANKLRPPLIATVTSPAARPGASITLYGIGLGPAEGARVLFDGIPAGGVTGTGSQLQVAVPERLAGRAATVIEVEYNGVRSQPWGFPLLP